MRANEPIFYEDVKECFLNEALEVIHATKRTLWLARAKRAEAEQRKFNISTWELNTWTWVEMQCRKKAEEYK